MPPQIGNPLLTPSRAQPSGNGSILLHRAKIVLKSAATPLPVRLSAYFRAFFIMSHITLNLEGMGVSATRIVSSRTSRSILIRQCCRGVKTRISPKHNPGPSCGCRFSPVIIRSFTVLRRFWNKQSSAVCCRHHRSVVRNSGRTFGKVLPKLVNAKVPVGHQKRPGAAGPTTPFQIDCYILIFHSRMAIPWPLPPFAKSSLPMVIGAVWIFPPPT